MVLIFHALEKEVSAFDADEHVHHDHPAPVEHSSNVETPHDHDHPEPIAV
jgi:hypothetical protein